MYMYYILNIVADVKLAIQSCNSASPLKVRRSKKKILLYSTAGNKHPNPYLWKTCFNLKQKTLVVHFYS